MERRRRVSGWKPENAMPEPNSEQEGAVSNEAQEVEPKLGPRGGVSRNAGANNPAFVHGFRSMRSEIQLSDEAFEDMNVQLAGYLKDIDAYRVKNGLSATRVMVLQEQARRAAREGALLNSIFARAMEDKTYRKKIQEPSVAASLTQVEKAVEGFQEKLLRMLGEDEKHEAEVNKLKNDGKPAQLHITIGNPKLDKKNMRSDAD